MTDPIVEEVRQARIKIEEECKKQGVSYKDHLLDFQKQFVGRLVSRSYDNEKINRMNTL